MIKGIVRNIDQLGRVTLPKEMRKTLKVKETDPVDIYLKDGVICIEPARLQCVCCGSTDDEKLIEVNGVHMCLGCIGEFREEAREK